MLDEAMEILLVEDDPKDVRLTMRELQSENVRNRVEVVRDGEEALDFLFCRGPYQNRNSNGKPKVILLDLKLPKVSGLEVLRAIKDDPGTRAVPVVVMTSSREQRDLVEGYRLGVNSYIQKPIDFNEFQATIKELGYYWLVVNQCPLPESLPPQASTARCDGAAPHAAAQADRPTNPA